MPISFPFDASYYTAMACRIFRGRLGEGATPADAHAAALRFLTPGATTPATEVAAIERVAAVWREQDPEQHAAALVAAQRIGFDGTRHHRVSWVENDTTDLSE